MEPPPCRPAFPSRLQIDRDDVQIGSRPPEEARLRGDTLLLVGPGCASACELEAYGFSKIPGTIVVGEHPTLGTEAEVARGQFNLPEGLNLQVPTGRFTLPDGSLFLEGQGVQPTVRIPIFPPAQTLPERQNRTAVMATHMRRTFRPCDNFIYSSYRTSSGSISAREGGHGGKRPLALAADDERAQAAQSSSLLTGNYGILTPERLISD